MDTASESRTSWRRRIARSPVAVLSAALHLLVLALIGLIAPQTALRDAAPPEPPVEVYLVPRATPEPAATPAPRQGAPLRPHRPTLILPTSPVAPLVIPKAPSSVLRELGSGTGARKPTVGDLRTALRRSIVGCSNPDDANLDPQERAHCFEVAGAPPKRVFAAPLDPSERARFDAEAAAQARRRQGPGPTFKPCGGPNSNVGVGCIADGP